MLADRSCDELDDVLFDRIDVGLHRLGDIKDEDDVDRAALPDSAEIDDFGRLAIFEDFDIFGFEIADRLAVVVGKAEIELDSAIGIEMLEAGITNREGIERTVAGAAAIDRNQE